MHQQPKLLKAEINKTQTIKHLNGKWLWDENGVQVEVIITNDSLTIQHGKGMTFQIENADSIVGKNFT